MARDEVQRVVDGLAESLHRSVVINDPAVRMLHASRHFGDEDPVRVHAVLNRFAGDEAARHVLAQGILQWSRPGRIPALESIGLRPRVGVVIRWQADVLGMLLVMDADETLTAEDLGEIRSAAEALGPLLAASHDNESGLLESAVASTLSREAAVRRPALELIEDLVGRAATRAARVISVEVGGTPPASSLTGVALRHALASARSRRSGLTLAAVDGRRAQLVAAGVPGLDDDAAQRTAEAMIADVRALLGQDCLVAAGVGSYVAGLDLAWRSAREAAVSAEAARRSGGGVLMWDGAGMKTLLARIPAEELDASAVPPELALLAKSDSSGRLMQTLQAFLDHAGAAPVTAEALFIHRTTLYYRLDRIRELTKADLDDGATRTRLHLGLAIVATDPTLLGL